MALRTTRPAPASSTARLRRYLAILAVVVAAGAVGGAEAEYVLVLLDGQELSGVDVTRTEDGSYVLTLTTGDKLTLPRGLVDEVRLSAKRPAEPAPETGIVETEPAELSGTNAPATTPSIDDRLEAIPDAMEERFPPSVVDPGWEPESEWDEESDVTEFDPADWFRSPIGQTWTPTAAYDDDADVFAGSRYTWRRNLIDNTWSPSDGFRQRDRYFEEPPLEPREYRPEVRFVEP